MRKYRFQSLPLSRFAVCDVVFFKHPSSGFMTNLGKINDYAVACCLRKVDNVVSSAEELLRSPFGLTVDDQQQARDLNFGHAEKALALVSVNVMKVPTVSEMEGLVSAIKDTGEFSHWRFVVVPAGETLDSLPAECLFKESPSPPSDVDGDSSDVGALVERSSRARMLMVGSDEEASDDEDGLEPCF